ALLVLILLSVPLGQVQASLKGLSYGITNVIAHGSEVPGRTFNVRWATGVDDSTRREKERELRLIGGQEVQGDESGRTWCYRWTRLSAAAVLHLLNDSAVEDTQGIDRTSARYVGNRKSDANFEWFRVLPFGTGRAALEAIALAPWLWVVLPIAGAIRVSRGMM